MLNFPTNCKHQNRKTQCYYFQASELKKNECRIFSHISKPFSGVLELLNWGVDFSQIQKHANGGKISTFLKIENILYANLKFFPEKLKINFSSILKLFYHF